MSELLKKQSNLAEEGSTVPEGSVVEWSGEETAETAETAPQSRQIGEIAVRDALKLPGGTEGANELPGDAEEEAEILPMNLEQIKKVIEGLNRNLSVLSGLASVIDVTNESVELQREPFLELLGWLRWIHNSSIIVGPRLPEGDGLTEVLKKEKYAPLMQAAQEGDRGVRYLQDYLDDSNNDVTNMSQLRGLVVKFIHDMQGAAARIPTNDPTEHKAGVEEMIKKIA